MTLLRRISSLRLNADAVDHQEKIRHRTGDFAQLTEMLQNTSSNATKVAVGREELRAAERIQEGYDQNRRSTLSGLQGLIKAVQNLPIDMKFDVVKMQGNNVEVYFTNSTKYVSDAWKDFVPHSTPNDHDEILEVIELSGVDVEEIRSDIEKAKSDLLILRSKPFPEAGDVVRTRQALHILNSVGPRISELVDPVIQNFFLQARADGVPFSEMTEEIIHALAKLGVLERIRVVLT